MPENGLDHDRATRWLRLRPGRLNQSQEANQNAIAENQSVSRAHRRRRLGGRQRDRPNRPIFDFD